MSEFNEFQKIVVTSYSGIQDDLWYGGVETMEDAEARGDGLFTFLLRELSTGEGCESFDDANTRLQMVIDDVRGVLGAMQDAEEEAEDDG